MHGENLSPARNQTSMMRSGAVGVLHLTAVLYPPPRTQVLRPKWIILFSVERTFLPDANEKRISLNTVARGGLWTITSIHHRAFPCARILLVELSLA